jgi:hypothetical protein
MVRGAGPRILARALAGAEPVARRYPARPLANGRSADCHAAMPPSSQ